MANRFQILLSNSTLRRYTKEVGAAQTARAHLLLERRAAYAADLEVRVQEEAAGPSLRSFPGYLKWRSPIFKK